MKRFKRTMGAALLAASLIVAGGTSAQAVTDAKSPTQAGGRVVNSIYSKNILKITNSLNHSGPYMYLPIGAPSSNYTNFKDTDMYFIGSNCNGQVFRNGVKIATYYGPIYYGISDTENIAVIYNC